MRRPFDSCWIIKLRTSRQQVGDESHEEMVKYTRVNEGEYVQLHGDLDLVSLGWFAYACWYIR